MSIISQARELRAQFIKLRNLATDEVSLQVPNLYPIWKDGVEYCINDRVLYNGVLYKSLQSHISQADWTPDVATSLFAKVLIPNENIIPEWEQPDSTNSYMIGDKVSYEGKVYISTIDNNVWSPITYGWNEIVE